MDTDFRCIALSHLIVPKSKVYNTTLTLTTDLTNSSFRSRVNSWNTVAQALRPEFQDRQATNIKAGDVDIDVPILGVDYAYNARSIHI